MDKLLEMLNVDKLDESAQTELKDKLEGIIEVKASEMSEAKLAEKKEDLIEEYENKFDEYKDDITSKFSNFVDSVLEEELSIPENILEYAHKGELYSELIEQFKVRLSIDEGLIDSEVKDLLKEAKQEILGLRDELNGTIAENLEVKKDAQDLASNLYLRKKCDGLTESQKTRVLDILEGVTDKGIIDKKFDIILESIKIDKADTKEEDKVVTEEAEEKDVEDGKGVSELNEDETKETKEDDDSPFKIYLDVLRDNKI
jgi:hypothetical protein